MDTSYERDFVVIQAFLHQFLVVFDGCGWFVVEFLVVLPDLGKKRGKLRVSRFGVRRNERDFSLLPNLCPKSTHVRHTCALTVSLKWLADGGD